MDTGSFDKLVNRIIDKKYKIESVIGEGGMAYVVKATDITDGKTVAIKFLNEQFRNDERAVKRFINESKTISMLDHENIVKIHDVVINDNKKYIVMEFIDGITLKDYIDKIGVLGWKESLHYIKQILSALSHAHEKQVIHRDIKPQNIMLLSDGTVKVTDFGIAKQPGAESITMTDKAIGTVNYISPEQASGGSVDTRTDIYSVGIMLYELVTGKLPFIADSPVAVAMMQVSNEPMAPREINSQIPVGLEQIILKAMQKDADNRFSSADAMLKALNYFSKNPDIVFAGSVTDTGATGAKLTKKDYIDVKKKEENLKKRIRGSRSMFPIVSGIAVAAILVLIFSTASIWMPVFKGFFGGESENNLDNVLNAGSETLNEVFGGSGTGETIRVASFIGKTYDDSLISEMEKLGYTVELVKPIKDTTMAQNVVVKQHPDPGASRIRPTATSRIPITLYVNMSKDETHMPNCVLMSEENAKAIIAKEMTDFLENAFSSEAIKVKYYSHSTYPKGYVISTVPEADAIINRNSIPEITLNVSMGKKIDSTVVPALNGKTKEEAESLLRESGLAVGKIVYEVHRQARPGTVIRATISGLSGTNAVVEGSEVVARGITAIDLYISIGNGTWDSQTVVPPTPTQADTTTDTSTDNSDTSTDNSDNSTDNSDTSTDNSGDSDSDISNLINMRG